jgi:hypothetical protein
MTETIAGSALMKEASKCSKTIQEYRSGYENLVGEVSGSDLKQISLDLSFTEITGRPLWLHDIPIYRQMYNDDNPPENPSK